MTNSIARRLLVALLPADIKLFPQAEELDSESRATMAVVIDTLRFTTTACQALQVGARCVHVAPTIERARQIAAEATPLALLCGERLGHRIKGFDLGNSPVEVTRDRVDGRELIFTTTNGTLAVEAVRQFPTILLAALVNRSSTCRFVREQSAGDIVIVCSGTSGQVTWEDVLTAGAIVDQLVDPNQSIEDGSIEYGSIEYGSIEYGNDSALLAHTAWQATLGKAGQTARRNPIARQQDDTSPELGAHHASEAVVASLLDELSRSLGGRNLIESGYQRDLQFAAQLDRLPIVARNQPGQHSCFVSHKDS